MGDVGTWIIIGVAVVIGIFFLMREVMCWYWKINKGIDLLEQMTTNLSATTSVSVGWKIDKLIDLLEQINKNIPATTSIAMDQSNKLVSQNDIPKSQTTSTGVPPSIKMCPKCSNMLPSNFTGAFCDNCGAKL